MSKLVSGRCVERVTEVELVKSVDVDNRNQERSDLISISKDSMIERKTTTTTEPRTVRWLREEMETGFRGKGIVASRWASNLISRARS